MVLLVVLLLLVSRHVSCHTIFTTTTLVVVLLLGAICRSERSTDRAALLEDLLKIYCSRSHRSIAQNHSCTIGRSRKTIFLHDRSIAQTCSLRDRSMVARTVDLPIAQRDRSIAQIDRSRPTLLVLLN